MQGQAEQLIGVVGDVDGEPSNAPVVVDWVGHTNDVLGGAGDLHQSDGGGGTNREDMELRPLTDAGAGADAPRPPAQGLRAPRGGAPGVCGGPGPSASARGVLGGVAGVGTVKPRPPAVGPMAPVSGVPTPGGPKLGGLPPGRSTGSGER